MAPYHILIVIISSFIPENLVLLTKSEQSGPKSAHIRPTINQFLILSFLLLFRQRSSPSHQKMLSFWYPGYQRFLSCVWRESSVSAKGRTYERRSHEKKLFLRVALWMKTWQKPETAQEKSLANRNHSGFSEIAGPSFPWFFFLWVSLWMNFSGGHFPLLDFFSVSSPPLRPPSLFQ